MTALVVSLDKVRRERSEAGKLRVRSQSCEDVRGQLHLARQLALLRQVEASAKALQESMRRSTVLSSEVKGHCARLKVLLGTARQ